MSEPITIEPATVYDDSALRLALGITSATLSNARRNGCLRFTRKGKRTLYLGEWVLAWLRDANVGKSVTR
jgi:hypothetical protein